MPIPQMFTNIDVLNQARQRYHRKVVLARQAAGRVPKPVDKEGKPIDMDVRHPTDIAALIIDTTGVPEEEREAYFLKQAEEITKAFYTLDEKTEFPYPEAIKPYIKMVYDKMPREMSFDWDNVEDVERLLAMIQVSQTFATFVKDFTSLVFELYPTAADVNWIDNFTANATLICHDARLNLASITDPYAESERMELSRQKYDSLENRVVSEVSHPIFDARIKGSNDIYLDVTASDFTKKHFLNTPFEDTFDEDYYNSDGYGKTYLELFAAAYKNASIEQMSDNAIADATKKDTIEFDRLLINGKPVNEILRELQEEQEYSVFDSKVLAGRMFRDALTDGKSVVTLMQVKTAADGTAEFCHQEIKVDLDQLNKVDREEGNYSWFRKLLDWANIWKIPPRFQTNDARDAAQVMLKESKDFKDALRAAEDKFLDAYNSPEVQKWPARFVKAMPKMTRVEKKETEKELTEGAQTHEENPPMREQLPSVNVDPPMVNIPSEPQKDFIPSPPSIDKGK